MQLPFTDSLIHEEMASCSCNSYLLHNSVLAGYLEYKSFPWKSLLCRDQSLVRSILEIPISPRADVCYVMVLSCGVFSHCLFYKQVHCQRSVVCRVRLVLASLGFRISTPSRGPDESCAPSGMLVKSYIQDECRTSL